MIVHWENHGEWGEDMTHTSGTVKHKLRGADGTSYSVKVGNTQIVVHENRVTRVEA